MDLLLILVVILIIVLVWRGPTMLPRLGEALGRTVKGVRENLPGAMSDEKQTGSAESLDSAESDGSAGSKDSAKPADSVGPGGSGTNPDS